MTELGIRCLAVALLGLKRSTLFIDSKSNFSPTELPAEEVSINIQFMPIFMKINYSYMPLINWFNRIVPSQNVKNPASAYDLWAAGYDEQPGNLMLALDEEIFAEFIKEIPIAGKVVVDIGCGTGRHWK